MRCDAFLCCDLLFYSNFYSTNKMITLLINISLCLLCFNNLIVMSSEDITFQDPPHINPNFSELIVSSGRNLTLVCSANQPVTWIYPENTDTDSVEESVKLVSATTMPDPDYPFAVMLEVIGILPSDVGYYSCVYNTSDNIEAEREDLEHEGKAKSVYVFVDDPHMLMVPAQMVVNGRQYNNITFPCKPTAPNVDVDLYIKEGETMIKVVVDKEIELLSGRKISYNRRIGFTLPELEMNDSVYGFHCVCQRDGINSTFEIMIAITPYTSSVTKPMITDAFNGNTVIDGEINLECNVRVDPGIQFNLKWYTPNTDIEPDRLHISGTMVGALTGKNNVQQKKGTSTFRLTGVTKEDEGVYKCEITDINLNKNLAEKRITVRNVGESFINLTEGANIYSLGVEVGKLAKWVIQVNAFPPPNITWFDNHNNRVVTPWRNDSNGVKISMISEPEVNPRETRVYIENAQLSDAGMYKVRATNQFETKELNLTLVVRAPPKASLYSDEYYLANTNTSHTIHCKVESYPVSHINWYFQDCIKKEDCAGLHKQDMTKMSISEENGYTMNSYLTMYANKSGHITCVGKNTLGIGSNTKAFYVSEVLEGFGIVGGRGTIAMGDNVTLDCIASVYKDFESTPEWYIGDNETPITNDNSNGYILIEETTKYSHKLSLWIPKATKSHSSNYTCKIPGSYINEQQMQIDVKDVERPEIVKSNLNNTDLRLHLGVPNQHFDCFAEGIPVPAIRWFKDNVELIESSKDGRLNIVNIEKNGRQLKLKYIKEEDRGEFKCVASSRVGSASRYVNIVIANGEFKVVYIASIAVLGVIFLVLILYLIWRIRKEKQIRKELSLAGLLNFADGDTQCLNPELGVDEQADLLPYDKKWEFPKDQLKFGPQLGSGAFGVVMKAKAYNIEEGKEVSTVAVKKVKKTAEPSYIKALASELKIMVHLGKHLNVVNLLGACTDNVAKRELFVIVEYCRFGNIHNYLLRHRGNYIDQVVPGTDNIDITIGSDNIGRAYSVSSTRSGTGKEEMEDSALGSGGLHSPNIDTNNTVISMVPASGDVEGVVSNGSVQPDWRSNYRGDYNYNKDIKPINTQDLICWAFQVARGMEYLASRKVLHGDLAARNILLADDNIVKICDFGLAKNMYKSDNYKKKGDGPLPVKWMAIESIRDRVFSTQSDVWSYGIVLWEMFSLAKTPYPGMEADEKFYNRLVKGYRMDKPEYATKHIYQTMLECWRAQPVQRPTFSELADTLGCLLENGVRNHYIDLNSPYIDMNNKWIAERGDNDYLAMMSAPDYGNLVSAKHDYVNDPFGGPTRVNPLSPDDTDDEGYLKMIPMKNGVIAKESSVFNFDAPFPRRDSSNTKEEGEIELVPMLKSRESNQRLNSVSDVSESYPTSPTSPKSSNVINLISSFSNPSYQPMFNLRSPIKEESAEDNCGSDSYVKMSQKDSGFIDSIDLNIPPSYNNPSYVTMTGNKEGISSINLPPTTVV